MSDSSGQPGYLVYPACSGVHAFIPERTWPDEASAIAYARAMSRTGCARAVECFDGKRRSKIAEYVNGRKSRYW